MSESNGSGWLRLKTGLAEIRNQKGEVLARSQGTFIAVDPHRMFSKYLTKSEMAKLV